MIAWVVLAALIALVLFPKSLERVRTALFAWTDHGLRNATPLKVLYWAAALVAVVAFAQIFTAELAWFAAFDAASFGEVAAAVAIAGAATRIELVRRVVVLTLARAMRVVRRRLGRVSAARAVRTQRPRKSPPPEDWAPAWA